MFQFSKGEREPGKGKGETKRINSDVHREVNNEINERGSSSRGPNEAERGGGSEGETAEDEKTNSPGERGIVEEMLQHPCQQRCVLLHELCYYRHQYHPFYHPLHFSASISSYGNGPSTPNEGRTTLQTLKETKSNRSSVLVCNWWWRLRSLSTRIL